MGRCLSLLLSNTNPRALLFWRALLGSATPFDRNRFLKGVFYAACRFLRLWSPTARQKISVPLYKFFCSECVLTLMCNVTSPNLDQELCQEPHFLGIFSMLLNPLGFANHSARFRRLQHPHRPLLKTWQRYDSWISSEPVSFFSWFIGTWNSRPQIRDFHNSEKSYPSLLSYDTVQAGRQVPTFWTKTLLLSTLQVKAVCLSETFVPREAVDINPLL